MGVMVSKERADQIAGGVFLIGLALLFMGVVQFWPGILFVIGASNIARGMAQGRAWYNISGGVWLIGLGVVFMFGFNWPLLLILIGVSMLLGWGAQSGWGGLGCDTDESEKPKHQAKRKNDELEDVETHAF
jgi:hypothetical protein